MKKDEITNPSYNIIISLPNDLTEQQAISLTHLAAPYGGVIITADKITFPSLLQSLPQTFTSTDLSYIAVRLVNEAKGQTQPVPFPDKSTVEELRRRYPKGSRIVLDFMLDKQAPPIGSQGTCRGVDDAGNVLCVWDEGGGLSIAYGADACHCVSTEQEAKESLSHFGIAWKWGKRCPRCGKVSDEPLYALSRRAKIQICDSCSIQEALESVKANVDIGKLYEQVDGVISRLDWAIMKTEWEK